MDGYNDLSLSLCLSVSLSLCLSLPQRFQHKYLDIPTCACVLHVQRIIHVCQYLIDMSISVSAHM